jgi:mitochondrial nucleoid factor 1
MASRYKKFLQLCQMWPLDPTKSSRDLGAHLRQQVGEAFRLGEATAIANPGQCDAFYQSLRRIASNYHGNKFHRARVTGSMGLPVEKISQIMTTNMMEIANEKTPRLFTRMKNIILRRPN